jgi:hypothetical protein
VQFFPVRLTDTPNNAQLQAIQSRLRAQKQQGYPLPDSLALLK